MTPHAPSHPERPGGDSPDAIGSLQLSVVMPVRNALPFLETSIRSVLAQTFVDFEFIIFDDNSTDGSRVFSAIDLTSNGNGNVPKLHMLGAMRLWAGRSPAVLRPLLAQGSLDWNLRTLRTLVWAGWGSFNPASLRFIVRVTIRTRDFLAGLRLKDGRPCQWR